MRAPPDKRKSPPLVAASGGLQVVFPQRKIGMSEIARGITRGKALRRSDTGERAFRTLVRHLHQLGPRPVGELLGEIVAAVPDAAPVLAARLEVYASLDPRLIDKFGADDWLEPHSLVRVVAEGSA
jgi:hypothetical protein